MITLDLHVHYRVRLRRQETHEEEAVQRAIAIGLSGLAFTEHHQMLPPERIATLNAQYAPFRVFSGVEVNCKGEDLLVFGIRHPKLDAPWNTFRQLHGFVKSHDGAICLAHPYRRRDFIQIDTSISAEYRLDAVEVRSRNTPPDAEDAIRRCAGRIKATLLSNSDAHQPRRVGSHCNQATRLPADDRQLAQMIRDGKITALIPAARQYA